jgi:hypothetical protein
VSDRPRPQGAIATDAASASTGGQATNVASLHADRGRVDKPGQHSLRAPPACATSPETWRSRTAAGPGGTSRRQRSVRSVGRRPPVPFAHAPERQHRTPASAHIEAAPILMSIALRRAVLRCRLTRMDDRSPSDGPRASRRDWLVAHRTSHRSRTTSSPISDEAGSEHAAGGHDQIAEGATRVKKGSVWSHSVSADA